MNGLSVGNIKKRVLYQEPVFLCRTVCRGRRKMIAGKVALMGER